ncbi:hypothetical protein C8R44DRAFT_724694 [Mycena epipterygia]|nr:hypothetical protein C8R44DRAFT_724694 [Mycena epipterygia]
MNTLLKDCRAGLKQALEVFKVDTGITILNNISHIQKKNQIMHQELLGLISNFSDESISDRSSSMYKSFMSSQNSSKSLSLLPAQPKIFNGRDSELEDVIKSLTQESACIAILGAGGMGKTSLAKAAVHSEIAAKYEQRLFTAADSATSSIELAALIGTHLGLKPGKDLTHAVVQYFSGAASCLLVLDNLETPWEPLQSRGEVEEFLSLLSEIPHLALIVTMRGAERPAKVRWTRPFLEPLKPLSDDAAYQTFFEIADDFHDPQDVNQLLSFTGNMPLAVNLIAHLVDYEGCKNILARWITEKTTLLSGGYDKESSLNMSIAMSLSSPRMKSCPGLYSEHLGIQEKDSGVKQITLNLGNLHQLLLLELHRDNPDLEDAINCTISLNSFHRRTGRGGTHLMDHIPASFPQPCKHQLEVKYITAVFDATNSQPIINPEHLIDEAMAHLHHFNDPAQEASFHIAIGSYYYNHKRDIPASAQSLNKGLSIATSCGATIEQLNALHSLAMLEYGLGDYSASHIHAREARQMAQLSTNLYREAMALYIEALCLIALGNLKQSAFSAQRARELLNLCGMEEGYIDHAIMVIMAEIHHQKSEYMEAHKIYHRSIENTSAQQYSYPQIFALLNIAQIDLNIGSDAGHVLQNLDKVKSKLSALGDLSGLNQCESVLADLNLREGNTLAAKEGFKHCLKISWGKDHQAVCYCLERLADVNRWTLPNHNASWAVVYLGYVTKIQEKLGLHKALYFLASVFLSEGDASTAHSLFTVALEGFTYMDVHHSRGNCLLHLGDITQQRGDLVQAVLLWKMARPLFEMSLQATDIIQIDRRLAAAEQDSMYTRNHIPN